MTILEEVSKILKIHTTEKSLDGDVKMLEVSGKFTDRVSHGMLIMIIRYLHEREKDTSL